MKKIVSLLLLLCVLATPLSVQAAPGEDTHNIVLTLGTMQWGYRIADLGAMSGTFPDAAILDHWIKTINLQLLDIPANGTETIYQQETGTYTTATAGTALQIRSEFAELLVQTLIAQTTSGTQPSDIQIDLNGGFLFAIPLGGVNIVSGTCVTTLVGSSANRIQNITVAASRLNNKTLAPGEVISVSDLLLPRTRENGYALAGVYVDGESVPGYGGGICQISSTLYNAAMNSGLEVLQRHPHSMRVSYLPAGLDAAISAGSKDLVIRNNYSRPIMLMAAVEGKQLVMSIYMNQALLGGKTYRLWSDVPNSLSTNTYLTTYVNGVEAGKQYIGHSNYMPH
ncbi:MAG: VanW family protein [Lachnospiraceae bacterium]